MKKGFLVKNVSPDFTNLSGVIRIFFPALSNKILSIISLAFRFSLCSVLREKIEDGYLSVNNAKDIIDKILFDNAGKIYV